QAVRRDPRRDPGRAGGLLRRSARPRRGDGDGGGHRQAHPGGARHYPRPRGACPRALGAGDDAPRRGRAARGGDGDHEKYGVSARQRTMNRWTVALSLVWLPLAGGRAAPLTFRREIARVFPDHPLVEVPLSHPIYHLVYDFPRGIPKIHEHDGLPAQGFGIFLGNRLVVYYSYQTDLGDGWEDPEVHHDPPELHEAALRMGVNLFTYAVSATR